MPSQMAIIFSVSAFVRFDKSVLLGHHTRLKMWLPVGGKIEQGETPLEALQREVQEEIGWVREQDYLLPVLDPLSPPGFLTYEEHPVDGKKIHHNFAFVLAAKHQEVKASVEFSEMRWFSNFWEWECPYSVSSLISRVLSLP